MFFLDLLPAGLWVRSGWYSKVKLLIKSIKPDLHNELSQNFQPAPFPSSLTHLVSLSFPASLRKAWLCQPVINPTCIKACVCSKTNRAGSTAVSGSAGRNLFPFAYQRFAFIKLFEFCTVLSLEGKCEEQKSWIPSPFPVALYRTDYTFTVEIFLTVAWWLICFFSFFFIKRAQISSLFKTNPGLFETFT